MPKAGLTTSCRNRRWCASSVITLVRTYIPAFPPRELSHAPAQQPLTAYHTDTTRHSFPFAERRVGELQLGYREVVTVRDTVTAHEAFAVIKASVRMLAATHPAISI